MTAYLNDIEYAKAYGYLFSQVGDFVDDDTKYWLEQAISINSDVQSPANTFIREFTKYGRAFDNIVLSPKELQASSNAIATQVLEDVIRMRGIQ